MADGLLDRIDTSQDVDIIRHYTRPLPLMAICDLLGIPAEDRDRVARWIAPISGPTSTWGLLRGLPGLWRIMRYFRADFARVRKARRPGLIGDPALHHNARLGFFQIQVYGLLTAGKHSGQQQHSGCRRPNICK